MRRLYFLLAALSLSSQATPSSLVPPEPLQLVGIAPDALPGQAGAPVTGILAVRAYGGTIIRLYDAATARPRRTVYLPPGADLTLTVLPAISPDGKWLAVALTPDPQTREGRVGVFSTFSASRRALLQAEGLRGALNFAFSPDGTRLAVGLRDSYAQLWDWQAGKRLNTVKGAYSPDRLKFSPDGRFFAPHFRGQTTTLLLDGHTGEQVNVLRGVGSGTFTPDGHLLASGGRYLSLPSGTPDAPPSYLRGGVSVQGYSRDGKRVMVQFPISAASSRPLLTFELREIESGRTLARRTSQDFGSPVTLLPDGRHVLTGDPTGGLRLLDLLP